MAEITAALVGKLREMTNAGMMDCKKALTETNGDMDAAVKWLRERGIAQASKRAGRVATEGAVVSYIHLGGKIGVHVLVQGFDCTAIRMPADHDMFDFKMFDPVFKHGRKIPVIEGRHIPDIPVNKQGPGH